MVYRRTSSGVPGLDDLIEGGFPANRVILVRGQTGTGKTTLANQFLMAGVAVGEPGVLVSVDQKPVHIIEDAAQFRWDLEEASSRGLLSVLDASPYFIAARGRSRLEARQVASDLTQQARRIGARRLVIDSLTSLVPEDGAGAEVHEFLRSLFFSLEDNLGCTVLMTFWNSGGPAHSYAWTVAEFLASGVVDLRIAKVADRFNRVLLVRKMRGTAMDAVERPFDLVAGQGLVLRGLIAEPQRLAAPPGVVIATPVTEAAATLTAAVTMPSEAPPLIALPQAPPVDELDAVLAGLDPDAADARPVRVPLTEPVAASRGGLGGATTAPAGSGQSASRIDFGEGEGGLGGATTAPVGSGQSTTTAPPRSRRRRGWGWRAAPPAGSQE